MTKKSHASPRYNGCKRHTPEETEMTQQTPAIPPIVDRATWQVQIDELREREKAHTREGDAIAAARRRLPMVEIDGQTLVDGPYGPVPFIDVFEGRSMLFVSYHMWHAGKSTAEQCPGCTLFTNQIHDLTFLHSRE
jgi:predicted dithiol-disulfide oxidoreductase (DUF899 family)